jgi:hypothetical protein
MYAGVPTVVPFAVRKADVAALAVALAIPKSQRPSGNVFHGDVWDAPVLEILQNGDDVRVVQRACEP